MRGDVEKWSASSQSGIDQPVAMALLFIKPSVAGEFSDDGLPDHAGSKQLLRAVHFRIHSPIVGHAEGAPALFRRLHH